MTPAAGHFRSKWVAGLLGLLTGSIGLHRFYLGLPRWWLYGLIFVPLMTVSLQAEEWFREPTFFVASVVTLFALFETIRYGLTPAEQWDERFNGHLAQKNARWCAGSGHCGACADGGRHSRHVGAGNIPRRPVYCATGLTSWQRANQRETYQPVGCGPQRLGRQR